jgi:hypothetical protein
LSEKLYTWKVLVHWRDRDGYDRVESLGEWDAVAEALHKFRNAEIPRMGQVDLIRSRAKGRGEKVMRSRWLDHLDEEHENWDPKEPKVE